MIKTLVSVALSYRTDRGGIVNFPNTELSGGTETIKSCVDVIRMDDVVFAIDRIGNGGEVDDGIAAFEGGESLCVVCDVGNADFRVGNVEFTIVHAVYLYSVVAIVSADLDDLLADCASGAGDCNLHLPSTCRFGGAPDGRRNRRSPRPSPCR